MKNITGNVINDEELITITSLNKEKFAEKIKNIYLKKKKESKKNV